MEMVGRKGSKVMRRRRVVYGRVMVRLGDWVECRDGGKIVSGNVGERGWDWLAERVGES
jgi:hypothetical protein